MGILRELGDALRLRNEEKRLQIETARAQYEAVSDAPEVLRERRQPKLEFTGEDGLLPTYRRSKAIARGRDLRRNYGFAQALDYQFRYNVAGTGAKIHFHTENQQWNERAARWFNRAFAKNCDGRYKPGVFGGRHLADQLNLALSAVQREGDVIVFFDAAGIVPNGAGKIWWYEADQLVEISDFDAHAADVAARLGIEGTPQQACGLIFDKWGRLHGFAVHGKHGAMNAKHAEVTILPVESAQLLSNPWRFGQDRGIAEQLCMFNDVQDLREFRRAVLLRQKTQAGPAVIIKKNDSGQQAAYRVTTTDKSDGSRRSVTDGAPSGSPRQYLNIEKWARNAAAYVEKDEDITALQLSGDSQEFAEFEAAVGISAGWSQGLSRLHSMGKADASYSAGMAEKGMDDLAFKWWQKWLERYALDWIAAKAIGWAIDTGRLPAQRGWTEWSWTGWPESKGINPDREAKARRQNLDNFEKNYRDLLGPDWRAKLEARAEEEDELRRLGLQRAESAGADDPEPPDDGENEDNDQ